MRCGRPSVYREFQSPRIVMAGSIDSARHAGRRDAIVDTSGSTTTVAAKDAVSAASTP
jgi:hypothetical protein